MKGFVTIRRNALELMHVYGASWLQTFVKLRFPSAVPFILTGLRSAAASAFPAAMLAEWLSGAPGLGTLILDAHSYRDLPLMWAAVIVTMAMSFGIFGSDGAGRAAADGMVALRPRRARHPHHRPGQGHGRRPQPRAGGRRRRLVLAGRDLGAIEARARACGCCQHGGDRRGPAVVRRRRAGGRAIRREPVRPGQRRRRRRADRAHAGSTRPRTSAGSTTSTSSAPS